MNVLAFFSFTKLYKLGFEAELHSEHIFIHFLLRPVAGCGRNATDVTMGWDTPHISLCGSRINFEW